MHPCAQQDVREILSMSAGLKISSAMYMWKGLEQDFPNSLLLIFVVAKFFVVKGCAERGKM